MVHYPYLDDKEFLKMLAEEPHLQQFLRIEILDFNTELPLVNIEGKATGGTCNINGSSSARRVANCSLVVDPEGIKRQGYDETQQYYNITEVQNLISLNKKIKLYVGYFNTLAYLGYYPNDDIIWMPLGLYLIKNGSVARSNNNFTISLTLSDKSSLLNGDIGGVLPASIIFSESETYNATGTQRKVEKVLLKNIIRYLIIELGGERAENVLITDIPDTIVKVVKWNGKNTVYLNNSKNYLSLSEIKPDTNSSYIAFNYGEDIGYMAEPFTYPGTLEGNAGDTIASILDKIKNILGNYEWFYDVYGRFIFQEKKNYINSSLANEILENADKALLEEDYFFPSNLSETVYEFNNRNKKMITSISMSPQFNNIKNDFVVWGTRNTANGVSKPIRYHLSFNSKPAISEEPKLCLVYKDYRDLLQVVVLKKNINFKYINKNNDENTFSNKKLYYLTKKENTNELLCFQYSEEEKCFINVGEVCYLQTDDWRTELYFRGLENNSSNFFNNYYAAELNSEWPKIYNVKKEKLEPKTLSIDNENCSVPVYKGGYFDDVKKSNYEYWLDFIEGQQGGNLNLSQFNINNIGRRTKVVTNDPSNCIFPIEPPAFAYAKVGDSETARLSKEMGYNTIIVAEDIYNNLSTSGTQNSAFDKIKELINLHSSYNETITLSVIPIFFLDANNKISILDPETGINGNYMINTISLPFGTNGTSNISATKCLEKTF